MRLQKFQITVITSVAILGLGYGVGQAADSTTLTLCASKTTGALRYSTLCKTSEKVVILNTKGDTGSTGPQGEVGPQGIAGMKGPQGETGAKGETGVEQLDVRVIRYFHTAAQTGYYNPQTQDNCLDGTIRGYYSANPSWGYCTLDVPADKQAYVMHAMNAATSTAGIQARVSVVSGTCASINFERASRKTDQDDLIFTSQISGFSPYGYQNLIRVNHEYANVRTAGLPLVPSTGNRCLILDSADAVTWTIALVAKK